MSKDAAKEAEAEAVESTKYAILAAVISLRLLNPS
jgi:hypothetical protein